MGRATMNRFRRWAATGALLALPWLLAALQGCALLAPPDTVVLSEREIAALVDKAFPMDRRLLEVLDVTIAAPRLTLRPERNRIAAEIEVGAVDRLFGQALRGRLGFESGLRIEPGDQSLRLAQVRVTELRLDDGAAPPASAQRLGAALAERVLEDLVLYRLKPEQQARLARAGVQAAQVTVTGRGVEIGLAPTAR